MSLIAVLKHLDIALENSLTITVLIAYYIADSSHKLSLTRSLTNTGLSLAQIQHKTNLSLTIAYTRLTDRWVPTLNL
jgi:hypothetical protein